MAWCLRGSYVTLTGSAFAVWTKQILTRDMKLAILHWPGLPHQAKFPPLVNSTCPRSFTFQIVQKSLLSVHLILSIKTPKLHFHHLDVAAPTTSFKAPQTPSLQGSFLMGRPKPGRVLGHCCGTSVRCVHHRPPILVRRPPMPTVRTLAIPTTFNLPWSSLGSRSMA